MISHKIFFLAVHMNSQEWCVFGSTVMSCHVTNYLIIHWWIDDNSKIKEHFRKLVKKVNYYEKLNNAIKQQKGVKKMSLAESKIYISLI